MGIVVPSWASAQLTSAAMEILIEEVLGYNIRRLLNMECGAQNFCGNFGLHTSFVGSKNALCFSTGIL